MFAAPPEIPAVLHARLPERLRRYGRPSSWLDAKRPGVQMHSFLEGPAFDRNGGLFLADIAHGRILRLTPESAWSVISEYDGWPTGLKMRGDGVLFVADNRLGILRLDPGSHQPVAACTGDRSGLFAGVNDLTLAPNGDLYFTDQGASDLIRPTGRIFRLRPDGQLNLVVEGLPGPNGLVLTPAGDALYVAVTQANAVWRVALRHDGTAGRTGLFVQLSGSRGGGPDGLAMDEKDNLVVAHPYLGSVWVFSPVGEPLWRLRSCAGVAPTNIAYGGRGRRSLFITESESGSILRAELSAPGMPTLVQL